MQSQQPGLPVSPRKAAGAAPNKEGVFLDLRPDKRGKLLELSVRQERLIRLQHLDAARVVVKKLHGGFSGSLVLQTFAFDAADRPDQPAVLKLDAAAALAEEVEKHISVQGQLGDFAIRIQGRPLYLGASGDASEHYKASEHATDADGAVMLELAGACWVLPEFFGKVADEEDIIVTFKQHLLEALKSGVDRNTEGVFEELYSVGGPLQRLAYKATFGEAATADGGFLVAVLEDICREVTKALLPPTEITAAVPESEYIVPASLLEAATDTGPLAPRVPVTKRDAFTSSFVHKCGKTTWGDAACAPLIALAKELRAQLKSSSWLANWRPLRLQQHGDLNAANVLIDARGAIWLIDFATTGTHEAFCDAAKLISVLVFEYLKCKDEDAFHRGCAMIDALVPVDGGRQLWEEVSPMPEQKSSPAHALALSLAAMVQQKACEMVISVSRRDGRGGVAAADVHPAALWLPLLREALRCLRYGDLSTWQKRTAWHATQRLSTALRTALQSEPVAPPERRADEGTVLKLSQGQLVLLTAQAASRKGVSLVHAPVAQHARGSTESRPGSPAEAQGPCHMAVAPSRTPAAECYEISPAGLHGLLFDERSTPIPPNEGASQPSMMLAVEDICHELGSKVPGAGERKAICGRAAELVATRMQRAAEAADTRTRFDGEARKQILKLMQHTLTDEEQKRLQDNALQLTSTHALENVEQRRLKHNALQLAGMRQVDALSFEPGGDLYKYTSGNSITPFLARLRFEFPLTDEEEQRFKDNARRAILRLAIQCADKRRAKLPAILRQDGAWAVDVMRGTGVVEDRRYAPEQQLLVRIPSTSNPSTSHPCWRVATVIVVNEDGRHRLRLADSLDAPNVPECNLRLHSLNHAPLELCFKSFEVQQKKYTHRMSVQHAIIKETLSGRPLDALEQCIPIGMTGLTSVQSHSGAASLKDVHDVEALCHWLHSAHAQRQLGKRGSYAAVLLTAPPAAGKTCLISQMVIHTLKMDGEKLVPLVIKVMDLQRVLRMPEHADHFVNKWNWADAYCCALHGEASPTYRFLRQALLARRVLLMLDGMDEGGLGKSQIEQHVTEVLLPQGHPMLLTSRPDSLVRRVYEGCPQLQLCPLTHDQQRAVIAGRLKGSDVQDLVEYVRSLPPDDHGNLLSGNPLMLNMFISIYESRKIGNAKGGMPETFQDVYEMASNVMLERLDLKERGGSAKKDAEEVRWLLREVAIETHMRLKRDIYMDTLQQAAKRLGASGQRIVEAVTEQLSSDRMPLLSVLEHQPLRVLFSHLTFQEYFAARAICAIKNEQEGRSYPGLQQPWKLAASWHNAVRLGADCGKPFGLGLLRAAGLEGKERLDFSGKFDGDSKAAVAAVAEMIHAASGTLTELKWSSNCLGPECAAAVAKGLKGNISLTDINLDRNPICGLDEKGRGTYTVESITKLCKALNASAVTSLSIRGSFIGVAGGKEVAAVLKRTQVTTLDLSDNGLCGIQGGGRGAYSTEGITALCEGLKGSAVTSLNISQNYLTNEGKDMSGVLKLAEALPQTKLTSLNLVDSALCGMSTNHGGTYTTEGFTKFCEALKNSAVTSLSLASNQLCGLSALGLGTYKAEGMTALCKALKGSAVTSLNLSFNGLGPNGGEAIAEVLKVRSSLTDLNLHYNQLGPEGGAAIAEGLKGNTGLKALNLHYNDLGPEGGTAIAEGLKGNTSLQLLNVCDNGLGVEGGKAFACVLNATQIINLNLESNGLGPEGGSWLAEGLRGNSTLTSLSLQANSMGDEAANAIADALPCTNITDLNFRWNGLDRDSPALRDAVQHCVNRVKLIL